MKNSKEKERVTVSFDCDTHGRLVKVAELGDVSISWVIRYAVNNFFDEWDAGQHQQMLLPLQQANGKRDQR